METSYTEEVSRAVALRRNFAIISHPDAGKTTLTEKLNVKNMTRTSKNKGKRGLNKSILDVSFGFLKDCLNYKTMEAGGSYIEIPTQKIKPSQRCPKCDHLKKKLLSERTHHCENCGYQCGRDFASAQVMVEYIRKGLGTSLSKRGESAYPPNPPY